MYSSVGFVVHAAINDNSWSSDSGKPYCCFLTRQSVLGSDKQLIGIESPQAQVNTQGRGRCPYDVGFLVVSPGRIVPYLFEFSSS